ncbi:hypothetical protein [Formosa sp. PL04]|uniref:hypothetical protein n=1 Tax=Formosa sp. PL04 TaxID=3081755 RepID=UPI0029816E39|nr:hypothetical protein [Formosa sp. PL04]MDW5288891.1 hypothetical protein [Formosa sp. PL04]
MIERLKTGLFNVSLIGIEGLHSVYSSGNQFYAEGDFKMELAILGSILESESITVAKGKLEVIKKDENYYVERVSGLTINKLDFNFNPIPLAKNAISAYLYVRKVSLSKGKNKPTGVFFEKFAVSLIGLLDEPKFDFDKKLFYHSGKDPAIFNRSGGTILVHDDDGGLTLKTKISSGNSDGSTFLDHFKGLTLAIPDFSLVSFDLTLGDIKFLSEKKEDKFYVKIDKELKLELDNEDMLGDFSFLDIYELRCIDGWITSTVISEDELIHTTLSLIKTDESHKGNRTKLVTNTRRLTFNYPIEIGNTAFLKEKGTPSFLNLENTSFIDVPHFVYESDLDEEPTLKNQKYGISIRNLEDENGAPIIMDADVAVIRYSESDNGEFFLQAGDNNKDNSQYVKVKGQEMKSILVPKPNVIKQGHPRSVSIPLNKPTVVINGNTSRSSFLINTQIKKFRIYNSSLELPPFRPGQQIDSSNLNSSTVKKYDSLNFDHSDEYIEFDIYQGDEKDSKDGIIPVEKEWIEKYKARNNTTLDLIDLKGAQIIYAPEANNSILLSEFGNIKISVNSETDENFEEPLEFLAFSASLVLGSAALSAAYFCNSVDSTEIRSCLSNKGKEYINIQFDITGIANPKKIAPWLKSNKSKNLKIEIYNGDDDNFNKNNKELKRFINNNIKISEPVEGRKSIGFWPVFGGIGIPLVIKEKNKPDKYPQEIVNDRFKNIFCGIGIDLAEESRLDFDSNFGFDLESLKDLAENHKYKKLFPTINGNESVNGFVDPTSTKFNGIVFRNMPLMVKLNVDTGKLGMYFKELQDSVNKNLFLEFGWKDESGFTWIARLPQENRDDDGFEISVIKNQLMKFSLYDLECIGHKGKMNSFSMNINFGLFQKSEDEYEINLKAKAEVTFDSKEGIDKLKIVPLPEFSGPIDVSNILPGFEFIQFEYIETDLDKFDARVSLYPNDKLAKALPIFDVNPKDSGVDASHVMRSMLAFDSKNGKTVLSLYGSSEKIRLFGWIPFEFKALNIIASDQLKQIEVVGKITLSDSLSIGGRVVIRQLNSKENLLDNSKWEFDIELDKIQTKLEISEDFKLEGYLAWVSTTAKTPNYIDDPSKVPYEPLNENQLIEKGASKVFLGILKVKTSGILGKFDVFTKVGSKNGVPFSVFGMTSDQALPLGPGTLEEPELVIASNSDIDNRIDTIVTNSLGGTLEGLRPVSDSLNDRVKWLNKFQYSSKTKTTLFASGKLTYPNIAETQSKNYSGVLLSSSGIFRVEAWVNIFGIKEVQLIFAIDTRNKRFTVGFQLPALPYPNEKNPEVVIRPGQVILGASYDKPDYFLLAMGWPPKKANDPLDRHWHKLSEAEWKNAKWPAPNVIGAGVKYEIDLKSDSFVFGLALKAGWKKDISFGIGKAGYDINFGGLLEVKYNFKKNQFIPTNKNLNNSRFLGSVLGEINLTINSANTPFFEKDLSLYEDYLEIKKSLNSLTMQSIEIKGEAFVNLTGYAKIMIFGITLAGVKADGNARMRVFGNTERGITDISGSFGLSYCVKIGSKTKCKSSTVNVVIVRKSKKRNYSNYQLLSNNY